MSDLARQVVTGFFPNWVTAEVSATYPNDITRYRLNIKGQRGEGILANPQWVLHPGDIVGALGPHPTTRQYLIIAYFGSVNPGTWFNDAGDIPDLTTGQGPIPGFRPPIGADSLWRDLGAELGPDTLRGHHLAPRPGPEPDESLAERIRVYGGYTDQSIESYGDFIVPGDRLRIVQDPGAITLPGPWCLLQPDEYLQAGTMVGIKPLGATEAPYAIGGGYCDPTAVDKTMVNLGSAIGGVTTLSATIKYVNQGDSANLFYLKRAPSEPDLFFAIRIINGESVVGVGRELLFGLPGYPSGGVGGGPSLESPTANIWFPFVPTTVEYRKQIRNRQGVVIGARTFNASEVTVTYAALPDQPPPPATPEEEYYPEGRSVLTVTNGEQTNTHYLRGQLYGGYLLDLATYAGDMTGMLVSPLYVQEIPYSLARRPTPRPLRGKAGEIFWHRKLMAGDPIDPANPGGATYADDPGDLLEDGLYVFLADDSVMRLSGKSMAVNSDTEILLPDWMDPTQPAQFPDHDQLGGLGDDDHEQYPTVARVKEFLTAAAVTTADIPASATAGYVTPVERAAWTAGAAPTQEEATTQVNGVTSTFTTASAFVPGTLRVTLNSTVLRNGQDFHEVGQGFEVDIRVPVATSPKDVIRVAYQPA